jgi:hypothetical protein
MSDLKYYDYVKFKHNDKWHVGRFQFIHSESCYCISDLEARNYYYRLPELVAKITDEDAVLMVLKGDELCS